MNFLSKKAIVITPTIGSLHLKKCHESVKNQTYTNVEHLIVVDGFDYFKKVNKQIKNTSAKLCILPYNTGRNGFYGHRVYAAFPHLINGDYVLFLDEDNWFEPNHIETLIQTIESKDLDWAFSLRNLYSENGEYLLPDNCESLGHWSPVELIDTSAYCFKLDFIRKYSFIWDFGWGADRRFFSYIKNIVKHSSYDCSKEFTLNYRLGGNENSVKKDFFVQGNESVKRVFKREIPWLK